MESSRLAKVLFVDDEQDNLDALRRLFRKTYSCFFAKGGIEALKIIVSNPDLSMIVSDQRMPEMSGVQLLEKCLQLIPQTVRILITGYSDIDAVIDAINSGQIYAYVSKPWEPEDLKMTLKRAEDHYRLERELEEKNRALSKALQELEQLDQAKSRFLSLLSHELRTPLTTQIGFMETLDDPDILKSPEVFSKARDRLKQSTQRLNILVEDALLLAQAQLREVPHSHRTGTLLNLDYLKDAIQRACSRRPRGHGLSIEPTILIPPSLSYSDSSMEVLSVTLTKLLDNAIKFAKTKVTVTVYESVEKNLCLFIGDDGPGIPEPIQNELFQKWGDSRDMAHHSQGLGLGLRTVTLFLHSINGRIRVINFVNELPHSTYGPPELKRLDGAHFLAEIPAREKLDLKTETH